MEILKEAQAQFNETLRLRRHFHENPEPSNQETETIAYLEQYLKTQNIPTRNIPDAGLLGILDSGKPGKTLLLRADTDALPIQESPNNLKGPKTCLSKRPGLSHACGHDASREASRIPPEAIYPALVNLCTGNKPGSATCPLPELALSLCRALRQSLGRNGRINKERPSC